MKIDQGFQKLGDYLTGAKNPRKKPPAYEWQDLALKVIKLLNIPSFKKNSVFKAVKDLPKSVIETAMNDTLELCETGEKWRYFFKIIDNYQFGAKGDQAEARVYKRTGSDYEGGIKKDGDPSEEYKNYKSKRKKGRVWNISD